nr:MAG TPA: hypothetical protein [Caudoviricetes sp.]
MTKPPLSNKNFAFSSTIDGIFFITQYFDTKGTN